MSLPFPLGEGWVEGFRATISPSFFCERLLFLDLLVDFISVGDGSQLSWWGPPPFPDRGEP